MPLNLASPGIVIREVDLTSGRVEPLSGAVGAQVAPFAKGPVNLPQLIESENDFLKTFGKPYSIDKHYEHWMVASSYLAYGGTMRIVRADDSALKNAFVGTASSIKIKSEEHYNQLGYDENTITGVTVAAKNPGTWANGIKVAILDSKVDQIITVPDTSVVAVGYGFTVGLTTTFPGNGTTSTISGYLKGVVVGKGSSTVDLKITSFVSGSTETAVDYQQNGIYKVPNSGTISLHNASSTPTLTTSITSQKDWFDDQSITLANGSTIAWNSIANRPQTSSYAAARSSRFDEVHVVVKIGRAHV